MPRSHLDKSKVTGRFPKVLAESVSEAVEVMDSVEATSSLPFLKEALGGSDRQSTSTFLLLSSATATDEQRSLWCCRFSTVLFPLEETGDLSSQSIRQRNCSASVALGEFGPEFPDSPYSFSIANVTDIEANDFRDP